MSALPHGDSGREQPVHSREPADVAGYLPALAALLQDQDVVAKIHDLGKRSVRPGGAPEAAAASNLRSLGRARKVSVSMPEELTAAVRQRVGRGEFSHYVTDAVARQLELDLLAELAEILDTEHGPLSEDALAEARAAWPDVE